ncbi:MAG: MFS transporter [Conexivisphaera sp.]
MRPELRLYAAKGIRVYFSGLTSILAPIYLARLGLGPLMVGLGLAAIAAGNVASNLAVTWLGLGRRRSLFLFASLMAASGTLLAALEWVPAIYLALFMSNVSTTGTEAGPFQSIEAGVLPRLVEQGRRNRAFGIYNVVGYAASSLGALSSAIPYLSLGASSLRWAFLGLTAAGVALLAIYRGLGGIEAEGGPARPGLSGFRRIALSDLRRLSALFSLDAFGGGFVSQSVLSYWFYSTYHASLASLGVIFSAANVITALSIYGASALADRIGNLRAMVYTHLISNVFLILIPLGGSIAGSAAFLFLRQSTSQMDVPTRQSMMAELFEDRERVTANALTNTFRTVSSTVSPPIAGYMMYSGADWGPLWAGGFLKIAYDLSIYASYRHRVK